MALISVDRRPTILGTLQANVNKWRTGPGTAPYSWQVFKSQDFRDAATNAAVTANLRFHTITMSNNGPCVVRLAVDTSSASTATSATVPFSTGIQISVGETYTLDVSSLGGVVGIRRILLINDVSNTSVAGSIDYADFTVTPIDFSVGFYTAQQSA